MKQEDKELLLKDLCARLPYKPLVRWREKYDVELTPTMLMVYVNEGCQPYLRSMSSITEDEEKELAALGRHIKITAFKVTPSKYHDNCITIQFLMEDKVEKDGGETTEWVQHIVFTGSEKIISQLKDLEIDPNDPIDAQIIKQNLQGGRCFYSITDP